MRTGINHIIIGSIRNPSLRGSCRSNLINKNRLLCWARTQSYNDGSIGRRYLIIVLSALLLSSCATTYPSKYPLRYYTKNETAILRIERLYNKDYKTKPFAVAFSDNALQYVVLEIKTDSLRYIYEFNTKEKRIRDTLRKFGYDTSAVMTLIRDMQMIKCTWINTLDYFVDDKKQSLTYMSIRPKTIDLPFANKNYYILTFYKQPQYYDSEGRLLDKRNRRRIREVNNEVFWRINDKVCYTLSDRFR